MLQHYFHESYQYRAKRRNIKQFKMSLSKNKSLSAQPEQFVCMSNGNAIQIYKISAQSVDFFMRKQFFCNITKLQVIPSIHHDSDFIFILDDLGRYSFWRPGEEQQQTSNVIQKQTTKKRYYRQQLSPQQEQQFSGAIFHYDVKDTVGYIFFTVQNKIVLLNISIKGKQGLRITNVRTYQIPYTRFRFVNCLKVPSLKKEEILIGIIQQLEQKTILKVHLLNPQIQAILIDEQSLVYKIQKTNLLSFESGQNDQIIVLTFDQISIYKYKQSQHLCNYRTRGNYGSVCYIQPQSSKNFKKTLNMQATYIHLGYEMTVFTKNRLSNYGPLKFEGKNLLQGCGIVQSKYLGHLPNGQVMITFITSWNEVYFVILFQNRWKLIRKIQSLSSIFSLHQLSYTQNPQSLIAVHSSLENQAQITHLQVISPTILDQQQTLFNMSIQSIDAIQNGQSLIVCNQQRKSLLSWSDTDKKWVDHFQFPNNKQQVLACTGQYVVMSSGIYKYTVSSTDQLSLSLILKQTNILSAVNNSSYIGYYTSEGHYKYYEFQSSSIFRIRKNCIQQYIWHMLKGKNILISAVYNQPGQVRILPIQKASKNIEIQNKGLVSAIGSISRNSPTLSSNNSKMVDQSNQEISNIDIVIGFYNGDIQVFSLLHNKTVFRFNIGQQMVNIAPYRQNHLIVYNGDKQYILSFTNSTANDSGGYQLHQIQFLDSKESKRIRKIMYLQKFDKFLTVAERLNISKQTANGNVQTNSIIQLRSLKLNKKLSDHELTLELKSQILMRTIFKTQSGEEVPYVQIKDKQFIYIALPQTILKYSIKTAQLLKKQLHLLKQITSISKNQNHGIIVAGVDLMESGSIVLFDFDDLNIKSTYNLGTSRPNCIKSFSYNSKFSNRFLVRHENYISILQIQPTSLITLIKTVNTKTSGFSMDINQKENKIVLSDPYRYISVWDYDLEISSYDILPVSKYFGEYLINDCCWLDGSIVTGDRGGRINILEFNLGNNSDIHKINMTKVADIYLGQQIFVVKRIQNQIKKQVNQKMSLQSIKIQVQQTPESCSIYYGTTSGSLGIVKTINQQQFKLLKQIQLDILQYINTKQRFSYEQWRKRLPQKDKLIDSTLIKYYLDEFRFKVRINQQQFYEDVKQIYHKLIGRSRKEIV